MCIYLHDIYNCFYVTTGQNNCHRNHMAYISAIWPFCNKKMCIIPCFTLDIEFNEKPAWDILF